MLARSFKIFFAGLLLGLLGASSSFAQTVRATDNTTLEEIIIFGRHGVRSSTLSGAQLSAVATDSFPDFGVPEGYLTPHGQQAAQLFGAYFHDYLIHEGLLTGNAQVDLPKSHFRANSIQRSNVTAANFGLALIPGAVIPVHSYPLGTPDPVIDPIAAGVAAVNPYVAALDAQGIYGGSEALVRSLSGEFALLRSVLFGYSLTANPVPPTPAGKVDVSTIPVTLEANTTPTASGSVIDATGLAAADGVAGTFLMEYADGMPLDQVAWGRLSADQISQLGRFAQIGFNVEMRQPYLSQVQSSNAAWHILRTLKQATSRRAVTGRFGDVDSRVVTVVSSDVYIVGVAGLLGLHWTLPGYQSDFCAPGGALVFELRRSNSTHRRLVRVYYTAQTLDQLRNLTPLTLSDPPATQQVYVPGGSGSAGNLDIDFGVFTRLVTKAIDKQYTTSGNDAPAVLTGVPLD